MVVPFTTFFGGKKPFRFFNYWTAKEDFVDKIREVRRVPVEGYPGFQISQKRITLKRSLREWFGQDKNQRDIRQANHSLWMVQEQRLANTLRLLNLDLDSALRQKAKMQWIHLGDKNTRFFHQNIKHRQRINRIACLHLNGIDK